MAMNLLCKVHTHRHWVPTESHHIHPLGYGGKNVKANRIDLCANGHSMVHYLLEALLKTNSLPGPPRNLREAKRALGVGYLSHFGFRSRRVAYRGYEAVMAHAESLAAEYPQWSAA